MPAPPEESDPAIINTLDFGFKLSDCFFYYTNTFIISHKGESMNEKFNNIIEFEKTNNFSRIK